jgi:GTPase KRas protein
VENIEPTACSEGSRKQIAVDNQACTIQPLDPITSTDPKLQELVERDWKQQVLDANAVILMYSVTSRETFQQVARIHSAILEVLVEASNYNGGIEDGSIALRGPRGQSMPICLVGNKIDLPAVREVSYVEGAQLAKRLGCSFFEASAKWDHTVSKAFGSLVRNIRQEAGDGQQRKGNKEGQETAREASTATRSGIIGCFVRLCNLRKP